MKTWEEGPILTAEQWDSGNKKTSSATCGAATANPSGAHEFTPVFEWG
jgi:hypothetical protein